MERRRSVSFKDWDLESASSIEQHNSTEDGSEIISEKINKKLRYFYFVLRELFERLCSKIKILDPQGPFLERWNKIFVITCVMAVSVDPIFFYIPVIIEETKCLHLDKTLQITACVLRTLFDLFYTIRIFFGFVTGYIAPSSRVFGRGELVDDLNETMERYLCSSFIIDLLSILPLPQVVFTKSTYSSEALDLLKIMVFAQYLPRFTRIYLIYKEIPWRIFGTTMWPVAAFHLYAYLLASHVFGSSWYLLSLDSELRCWKQALKNATISNHSYLSCEQHNQTIISVLNGYCVLIDPDEIKNVEAFDFGIYFDALASHMVESSTTFLRKLLYCFLWALRNISSVGQNLKTGTFIGEMIFVIFISIFSLVFISVLIGNLQTYLSSRIARVEEMMIRGVDIERWMSRRMLPEDLRERIRLYENYKWQETEGFNEETLVDNLPKELGRDIKRHLCMPLLRRVPLFGIMDERLLDGLCYKLKVVFHSENSYIVREGDPVEEMLFIMRGNLESIAIGGGRTGFINLALLRAGDFWGEELLTWALDSNSSHLPISTRTVKTVSEVEAFALMAADLKFVASNFRRLHSNQVQHMFRFYSHQWRIWAACSIQAAWRRYNKRKIERSFREAEDNQPDSSAIEEGSSSFDATVYASRFSANALRTLRHRRECNTMSQRLPLLLPQKPAEPSFVTEQQ